MGNRAPFPSPIGVGCAAFTGGYGTVGERDVATVVRQALSIGVAAFDLADFYAGGEVERMVGAAIAGYRDEAFVATRGGLRFDGGGRPTGIDGSPEHLSRACDASLRRLGIDRIDLYYLARVDPRVPVEESVGRLGELVARGKIRYIGLSRASAGQLRRAHSVHPIAALAGEYSLLERGAEAAGLPAARALGVTVVACRPLARGLLTGRIGSAEQLAPGDLRLRDRRFSPASAARRRDMLLAAEAMAAQKDVSLGRLALAWLLAQPDVVPVPSTRSGLHLEMNAAALAVRLTAEDRARLAAIFPAG
jgi:aryl-alcohol dehydrogenase-like predicted oxidoreductase